MHAAPCEARDYTFRWSWSAYRVRLARKAWILHSRSWPRMEVHRRYDRELYETEVYTD